MKYFQQEKSRGGLTSPPRQEVLQPKACLFSANGEEGVKYE